MNFLDLLIALPLGYTIYKGYKRGLVFEAAALAAIILGSILAVRLANGVAQLLPFDGDNALLVSFFIIFVAVVIGALALAKLAERFIKLVHVGALNNIAGALFGMIKGVCIVGVLIYYVAIIDIDESFLTRNTKENSLLYHPVERSGQRLAGKMSYYLAQREQKHEEQEAVSNRNHSVKENMKNKKD